jgi:hypothetical protein
LAIQVGDSGRRSGGGVVFGSGGAVDTSFGQAEEPGDEQDRYRHEEHLVPAALMGEDPGSGDHGIDRTGIAD